MYTIITLPKTYNITFTLIIFIRNCSNHKEIQYQDSIRIVYKHNDRINNIIQKLPDMLPNELWLYLKQNKITNNNEYMKMLDFVINKMKVEESNIFVNTNL
jgi:hypothetical protein